jgi:hypothetical protein
MAARLRLAADHPDRRVGPGRDPFIAPYFGAWSATRAKPDNIAARKQIRERGLALLSELHKKEYERIIVVGHSLGSIPAYDLTAISGPSTRPRVSSPPARTNSGRCSISKPR